MAVRRRGGTRLRAQSDNQSGIRFDGRSCACGLVVVLLAVLPAIFNPRGQNAFDVVKSGVLQVFGVLAGAAALSAAGRERFRPPMGVPTMAAVAVVGAYVAATLFGDAPVLSFLAPDVRHEGTYVLLASAATAFAVSTFAAPEVEAVILAIVIGSIGPSLYAVSEMLSAWSAGFGLLTQRAGGTFGNPMLMGGYLAMVIPITFAVAIGGLPRDRGTSTVARPSRLVWWFVLALQMMALASAKARGAMLAALVVPLVFAAARIDLDTRKRRLAAALAVALLAVVGMGILFALRARYAGTPAGQTLEVREIIWRDVARAIAAQPRRLLLGFGPTRLRELLAPYYSPRLALLEGSFAVPDRAHNEILNTIVDAGLLGAIAVVTLHVALWVPCARRVWRRGTTRSDGIPTDWLAVGLLAAAIVHFVDIQAAVASMASRLVWWSMVGIVVARSRGEGDGDVERPHVDANGMVAAIAGSAATAALVFGCWRPGDGLDGRAVLVITVTGVMAVIAALGASGGRSARPVRLAVVSIALPSTMVALLAGEGWATHEVTMCLVFLLLAGAGAGYAIAARRGARPATHRVALAVVVSIAILLVVTSARPLRAELLAASADRLGTAGRWLEVNLVEEERVGLTPESDLAWSALGRTRLEIANRSVGAERRRWFERATAALDAARRRNPLDWFHVRNQASAERQWAAADRDDRAIHLRAADEFYRRAAAMAPASGRLWAEWGNVDAERGALQDALTKLERAAALGDDTDASVVVDAILRAAGNDVNAPGGLDRAASQFERAGRPALSALYAKRAVAPSRTSNAPR